MKAGHWAGSRLAGLFYRATLACGVGQDTPVP